VLPSDRRTSSLAELPVFYHSAEGFLRGVMVGRLKWNALEGTLFDVKNDPSETLDLATAPPEIRGQLERVLDQQFSNMRSEYIEQWIGNRAGNFYEGRIKGKKNLARRRSDRCEYSVGLDRSSHAEQSLQHTPDEALQSATVVGLSTVVGLAKTV
jgi:hypothetical protein